MPTKKREDYQGEITNDNHEVGQEDSKEVSQPGKKQKVSSSSSVNVTSEQQRYNANKTDISDDEESESSDEENENPPERAILFFNLLIDHVINKHLDIGSFSILVNNEKIRDEFRNYLNDYVTIPPTIDFQTEYKDYHYNLSEGPPIIQVGPKSFENLLNSMWRNRTEFELEGKITPKMMWMTKTKQHYDVDLTAEIKKVFPRTDTIEPEKDILSLEKQLSEAEGKIASQEQQINHLTNDLQKTQSELTTSNKKIEKLEENLAKTNAQLKLLFEMLSKSKPRDEYDFNKKQNPGGKTQGFF